KRSPSDAASGGPETGRPNLVALIPATVSGSQTDSTTASPPVPSSSSPALAIAAFALSEPSYANRIFTAPTLRVRRSRSPRRWGGRRPARRGPAARAGALPPSARGRGPPPPPPPTARGGGRRPRPPH